MHSRETKLIRGVCMFVSVCLSMCMRGEGEGEGERDDKKLFM